MPMHPSLKFLFIILPCFVESLSLDNPQREHNTRFNKTNKKGSVVKLSFVLLIFFIGFVKRNSLCAIVFVLKGGNSPKPYSFFISLYLKFFNYRFFYTFY